MADVPAIEYQEQARKLLLEDSLAQLPPKVRAIAKDKELSCFVHQIYSHSAGMGAAVFCATTDAYKPSPECSIKVATIKAAQQEQSDARKALQAKLRAVAYSVTTRKALCDALPEFEKYLPADAVAAMRSLPVVQNVVAEFVKAGWPKAGKAVKA